MERFITWLEHFGWVLLVAVVFPLLVWEGWEVLATLQEFREFQALQQETQEQLTTLQSAIENRASQGW